MRKLRFALACVTIFVMPAISQAAVTMKDIQVAGRVLAFMANPPSSSVKLGIVYDPTNAASAADEQSVVSLLGAGLQVGTVFLIPVPVTLDKITATPVDVFLLTSGLAAAAAPVTTEANQKKILCITTDPAATKAGYCAVSIETDPKVEITINKAEAAASSGGFASAFIMMVTEI